ncbi:MAG: M1 family aminopeptidase [Terracidiphilus sp.]
MKTRCSPPSPITAFAFLFVSIFVAAVTASAQRLPQTVRPEHYALTLTPDLKAATFTGDETIDAMVKEPTRTITLNAVEIEIQSVWASIGCFTTDQVCGMNVVLGAPAISLDKEKQQATFTYPNEIAPGKLVLHIRYAGILNDELRGFYLSKTARRNYAVTQFEPTDARRAFPSFDEPAFKATFDATLVIDSGDTAISNMPIVKDTPGPGDGKHTLEFGTTPKMSTYLVAFLVGDFQCSSGEQDGVAIRVCATPDKVALTAYGVSIAKYVLHCYNSYFGIPYPLPKLDLIALPDFEAGAMENFGAITYRETELLIDEKTASVDSREGVASVIAHEMAHQWFGDLVTMQWWDNLWLSEGFATWMSNKPVAAMHPEWNIDQSVISGLDGTLDLDSRPTTRPIRARADTPAEINEMFDGIAYGKASDVLLTVENYLGPETFRKGVHAYLSAHLYANATAEDFWNAQTATSHKPVDKIMESLVIQPGEPLLTFGEPSNGKVSVEQKRFFLDPRAKPDSTEAWTLPVCFVAGQRGADCELLSPADSSLKIPSSPLFFADVGGKGYYRSKYPVDVYEALVRGVETSLTPVERISLIGDEWAQVRANAADVGQYLDLVAAVKADPNAEVVDTALSGVDSTYMRIASTQEEKDALSAWIRATFAPEYAKLGPPSDSDSANTRELRAALFGVLGYYGKDPQIVEQAREIAGKYLANPASVEPTLGRTATFIAARNGDAALFDELEKIYETSTNPDSQENALRLLTQFQDPALLERALDLAASGKVRNQDAAIQFSIALGGEQTQDATWKYIQAHWDKVQAQLTTWMGGTLVESVGGFCTEAAKDDVQSFFSTHKVAASERALKQALERINGCVELRSLQEPKLKDWLAGQPKS